MGYEQDATVIRLAQERYARSRDNRDLTEIYRAAARIAEGIIERQCKKRRFFLDPAQKREKAHDAAAYVAVQYMTRKGFSLKKPAAYIYTCVLRELFHRKAVDRNTVRKAREKMGEDFCDE